MKKMVKRKGNYAQCWEYLKESKNYFKVVLAIFLIFTAVGFIFPVFFNDAIEKLMKDLVAQTAGMNGFQLFVFIFANNFKTSLIGMLFGLGLGIFPLILCVFNGYVLGFVARKTSDVFGYSILLRLFPHGIFEIPALVISLGLGMRLGMSFFKKDVKKEIFHNLINSLKIFAYIIIPLLIIAAIIEAGFIVLLG